MKTNSDWRKMKTADPPCCLCITFFYVDTRRATTVYKMFSVLPVFFFFFVSMIFIFHKYYLDYIMLQFSDTKLQLIKNITLYSVIYRHL